MSEKIELGNNGRAMLFGFFGLGTAPKLVIGPASKVSPDAQEGLEELVELGALSTKYDYGTHYWELTDVGKRIRLEQKQPSMEWMQKHGNFSITEKVD